MFCGKCGTQVENGARFCPSCGTPVEAQPAAQVNQYEAYEPAAASVQPTTGKYSHKLVGAIACAVVVVIVIVGAILIFGGSGKPDTVTEKYLSALFDFNYGELNKYSAINMDAAMQELFAYDDSISQGIMDYYGTTNIKKLFEGPIKTQMIQGLKDQFGNNYSIRITVTDTTDLTKSQVNSMISDLRTSLEDSDISNPDKIIKTSSIKAICRVSSTVTIKGSEDSDSQTINLYCAKMGGKWKVLDTENSYFANILSRSLFGSLNF